MNKKLLYLIGALVGVAVVTLLMSSNSTTPAPEATSIAPEAVPANGLVTPEATATGSMTATDSASPVDAAGNPANTMAPAPVDANGNPVPGASTGLPADTTDMPEDASTPATDPSQAPAGSDELPAGAEVAPQPASGDEKMVTPSEGQ